MLLRTLSTTLVGCALLAAPLAASAADRGPSTPEERQQALEYIQHFQADPLNPALKPEVQWLTMWSIEIPDVHVYICLLDKLPKGDKKDSQTLFTALILSQLQFALQNPDKQNDKLAQLEAGIEGELRIYELLLKAKPKDRQPDIDDLIQRREAGTLAQYVKERAAAACKF
jgi:hypothetical protein